MSQTQQPTVPAPLLKPPSKGHQQRVPPTAPSGNSDLPSKAVADSSTSASCVAPLGHGGDAGAVSRLAQEPVFAAALANALQQVVRLREKQGSEVI